MHPSTKESVKANSGLINNSNVHILFVGDITSHADFKRKDLF